MNNTIKRIRNQETLSRLGGLLRRRREEIRLAQGRVRGMRQATISKIERGGDVNLDTVISYASALGMELTLVPIGQGQGIRPPKTKPAHSLDLLDQFADLEDETP